MTRFDAHQRFQVRQNKIVLGSGWRKAFGVKKINSNKWNLAKGSSLLRVTVWQRLPEQQLKTLNHRFATKEAG